MNISQKCQYAMRAVFELAKRYGDGPTTVADIARMQAIPHKFLELILGELKQGRFVDSRRGPRGGYLLVSDPDQMAVGQIIRFVDGPIAPVDCLVGDCGSDCPIQTSCAFKSMWIRARDAMTNVYDQTTFQDLLDEQQAAGENLAAAYSI